YDVPIHWRDTCGQPPSVSPYVNSVSCHGNRLDTIAQISSNLQREEDATSKPGPAELLQARRPRRLKSIVGVQKTNRPKSECCSDVREDAQQASDLLPFETAPVRSRTSDVVATGALSICNHRSLCL